MCVWKVFLVCIKKLKHIWEGLHTEGFSKGNRLVVTLQGCKLYVNDAYPVL